MDIAGYDRCAALQQVIALFSGNHERRSSLIRVLRSKSLSLLLGKARLEVAKFRRPPEITIKKQASFVTKRTSQLNSSSLGPTGCFSGITDSFLTSRDMAFLISKASSSLL